MHSFSANASVFLQQILAQEIPRLPANSLMRLSMLHQRLYSCMHRTRITYLLG